MLKLGIPFVKDRVRGTDKQYHILYCTIQLSTGKFYVGIHSTAKEKDSYLGCGITCNIVTITPYVKRALKRSHLWKAVIEFGVSDFQRIDIFYFSNRELLIEAEKIIVTKQFICKEWNFNIGVGGGMPPIGKGVNNGNYGNRWTKKQRERVSNYFKNNRDNRRGRNPKALKCVAYDIFTKQVYHYDCGKDLADALGLTHLTINTWLRNKDILNANIRAKRFVCFLKSDYEDKLKQKILKQHIEKVISKSKVKINVNN